MRKLMISILAAGVVMFMATSSFAVLTYGNNDVGGNIVEIVPTAAVPGAVTLEFNPSPRVVMSGASNVFGFVHDALHEAAVQAPGGQMYGMASDTNKIFFRSIESYASVGAAMMDPTTWNSSAFDASWAKMK